MKAAYNAVASDETKSTKFLEQMFALAGEPFNMGDENIARITAPVLIIQVTITASIKLNWRNI